MNKSQLSSVREAVLHGVDERTDALDGRLLRWERHPVTGS